MNRLGLIALSLTLAAASAAAQDSDYSKGILFINEDWYGHQNSTVNYLMPDADDGIFWKYRIFQSENPGSELGCTNQYGAIWNGRLYLIAKQDKDPGASITGGRITVADAKSLKLIKQLQLIDPSGRQCDGRAFVGVSDTKGYVSSSNGIWILNLQTLEIEGQIEGSANPNAGDDKPNTDPTSSLYFGQTGTMVMAAGKVFAVHQQYGLLVIDPSLDKVVQVLDMGIVDDAVERDKGTRPSRPSGIGSTIVRAHDGSLWYSASKNVQGTGSSLPYIIRLDPGTLQREVITITGDDIYPPGNSWYAWTPDAFCASRVTNTLYWCGGNNSWFTNYRIYKFDIDTRKVTKIIDYSSQQGDWHVYGCSIGIHPQSDQLYASVFHKFVDPTYEVRRYDADGRQLDAYPMISNYWFPSLPVFPTDRYLTSDDFQSVTSVMSDSEVTVSVLGNDIIVSGCDSPEVYTLDGRRCGTTGLLPGIYVVRAGSVVSKVYVR